MRIVRHLTLSLTSHYLLNFVNMESTLIIIVKWIHNYLTNRKQSLVVNGASSEPINVVSGIPQGSIFVPLLFLIYTNDVADVSWLAGLSWFTGLSWLPGLRWLAWLSWLTDTVTSYKLWILVLSYLSPKTCCKVSDLSDLLHSNLEKWGCKMCLGLEWFEEHQEASMIPHLHTVFRSTIRSSLKKAFNFATRREWSPSLSILFTE